MYFFLYLGTWTLKDWKASSWVDSSNAKNLDKWIRPKEASFIETIKISRRKKVDRSKNPLI